MKLVKYIISFLFLIGPFVSFCQVQVALPDGRKAILYDDGTWVYQEQDPLSKISVSTLIPSLEIPIWKGGVEVLHKGYSLCFDKKFKESRWVAYELTASETESKYERADKFSKDPLLKYAMAKDIDYKRSGYDKGHLAPAADMSWNEQVMLESFFYSNVAPQTPGFNRGIWKRLEELVRNWAVEYGSVYVVTGPVLSDDLPTIGLDRIPVPSLFYKVILEYNSSGVKGIGFVLPNEKSENRLDAYAVTIDSVEHLTGIDFFYKLDDQQENIIESNLNLKSWIWDDSGSKTKKQNQNAISSQCKGTTKSGERCKNKTLNANGYCYLHQSQAKDQNSTTQSSTGVSGSKRRTTPVQCSGTTKSGAQCKRMTYSPNGYCYQHGGD